MTTLDEALPDSTGRLRRFRAAYGRHRAAEGRGAGGEQELLSLPYVRVGPHARQWSVRARTFEALQSAVLAPLARALARPVRVLDVGAGNGWLCYRLARIGHRALALDVRADATDGLGAASPYAAHLPVMFGRVAGSFDALPFDRRAFDLAVFNASLHYALDLDAVVAEAARVVAPGGVVAILDSPFYPTAEAGDRMVAEKRRSAARTFGVLADDLTGLPFVEYLTSERLATATAALGLSWRRHRVRYPLFYEARPLAARLLGRRVPSRFDLWEARVP